ncbi:membrane protein [Flavobacterium psychrophilum]|uniref:Uncharacterized protein n=1 Tax=Flavobacterium psychrophilum (strain ATCC 49511 / DSM 21280 / CIP 103535 / JIP02/86) TaxID=402612 RepID=A6GXK4_FLAPJ|nr:DUF6095 family protein [Flavobacterium psychrophilum]AIG29618.1 membrane protein [Flavobacterium psychrophilum]AIG31895.1 membrane protein [Flavobacterium psychrophilum]AIG34049.1 membrane protein [Flavobacterium psychrophilum]AIG36413.1 membrane protein [Flavobacterium psychrophilum]AIG38678.1 membrane protein [Flavobacterium psychrophilum]
MSTNKEILFKGIKYIALALPLYFIGPSIIYNAFVNKGNIWHYLVLAIGIIASFFAVFLTFRGLKTIMQSLFDGNK